MLAQLSLEALGTPRLATSATRSSFLTPTAAVDAPALLPTAPWRRPPPTTDAAATRADYACSVALEAPQQKRPAAELNPSLGVPCFEETPLPLGVE